MDARRNPYAPGAGTPPPKLAGRDQLLGEAQLALERIRFGFAAKSFVAVGLRGVGKTVLLNQIQALAEAEQFATVYIEAYDDIKLPEALTQALRPILLKLSRKEAVNEFVGRAIGALRNFAASFKVSVQGLKIEVTPEPGLADSGDITLDLPELLIVIGEAARQTGSGLALVIDELQHLSEGDLAALIMAVHRCNQKKLPVVLFGAGLP